MRTRPILSALSLALLAASSVACGNGFGGDASGAPEDGGPPTSGPGQAPPTGGKWEGRETTDECGRTSIEWILVDEVCAGTESADYLEHFRAPILRDGALIGDRLYAVDATHVWVLDVTVANEPVRTALLSGFGQPLAAATHGGRLLLAAGSEGLIVADVTSPDAPARVATVATDGPAMDVFVDGDLAYVANGHGGILVVDLAGEAPEVVRTLEVPGFAAGVAVSGGVAYAAACESVVSIDAASGEELGSTWLDDAHDEDGRLVAPAKDVVVVGDQLFVAAGRYGAVRVDVASPEAPAVVGNCTLESELGFYASGVRTQGDRLFVAGGEWGILPVETDPTTACTTRITPELIPAAPDGDPEPGEGEECSTTPPWEVLPWEETWLPPVVAGQDPLQTLPVGEVLFAFGDATRIGMRAVDVRLADDADLTKIGRFDEPRLTTGIAAHGPRVMVLGQRGGLFTRAGDSLIRATEDVVDARQAVDAAFLEDGRWVLAQAEPRRVVMEGGTTITLAGTDERVWPGTLTTTGQQAVLSAPDGAFVIDASGSVQQLLSGRVAALPASVAADANSVVLAAPEWADAIRVADTGAQPLGAHGVFGAQEAVSADEWRQGLPRRLLASTGAGVLELATLGRRAGVALHAGPSPATVELPPGEYVDLVASGDRAYAVSIDRGTYRSQLVTIDLAGGAPRIVGLDAWTGMASGVAATFDGVYVADRDDGVRIYDTTDDGVELAAVASLAEAP